MQLSPQRDTTLHRGAVNGWEAVETLHHAWAGQTVEIDWSNQERSANEDSRFILRSLE